MPPIVSIVTSVLNGAPTLSRCLASVANQTLPCEHIVVDGGSTDGSQDIVRAFGPPRPRLIEAPGAGISQAFNIGVQQSSGEFIGILNADDWLEPDAIARSVEILRQCPEAGFSYGAVLVHNTEHTIRANPLSPTEDWIKASVIQMPFFHISSLVRRSVYEQYGLYDESYRIAMDFDLYARIITQGVRGVAIPGLIGHVTGGGVSAHLGKRLAEYWQVSVKYISPPLALYHVLRFAMRSVAFELLQKSPRGRRLLTMRKSCRFEVLE